MHVGLLAQDPHADGTMEQYNARLVAKGFMQTYGVDYDETWAPTGRAATLRVLLPWPPSAAKKYGASMSQARSLSWSSTKKYVWSNRLGSTMVRTMYISF
jgi:hypothetical protein